MNDTNDGDTRSLCTWMHTNCNSHVCRLQTSAAIRFAHADAYTGHEEFERTHTDVRQTGTNSPSSVDRCFRRATQHPRTRSPRKLRWVSLLVALIYSLHSCKGTLLAAQQRACARTWAATQARCQAPSIAGMYHTHVMVLMADTRSEREAKAFARHRGSTSTIQPPCL